MIEKIQKEKEEKWKVEKENWNLEKEMIMIKNLNGKEVMKKKENEKKG